VDVGFGSVVLCNDLKYLTWLKYKLNNIYKHVMILSVLHGLSTSLTVYI